jgi:hypothetical protein
LVLVFGSCVWFLCLFLCFVLVFGSLPATPHFRGSLVCFCRAHRRQASTVPTALTLNR